MPIPEVDKIWMNGELVPWARRQGPRADARAALRLRGLRGHPLLQDAQGSCRLPSHRASQASASAPPSSTTCRCPTRSSSSTTRRSRRIAANRPRGLLHPAARLPRLRRDGAVPAEGAGGRDHRRLALGHLPRRGGHQARRPRQGLEHPVARPHGAGPRRQGHGPVPQQHPRQDRGDSTPATTRRSCSTEHGHVAEGSGENIFVVRDGVLRTPPPSDGVLEGITRDIVMQAGRRRGHRAARSAPWRAATW